MDVREDYRVGGENGLFFAVLQLLGAWSQSLSLTKTRK